MASRAMQNLAVKLSHFENVKPAGQNSLMRSPAPGYSAALNRASGKSIQSLAPGLKTRGEQVPAPGFVGGPKRFGQIPERISKPLPNYQFKGGPVKYSG